VTTVAKEAEWDLAGAIFWKIVERSIPMKRWFVVARIWIVAVADTWIHTGNSK
jgi:hypothetical protein